IETVAPMVCRGVLLDIPAVLAVDCLAPDHGISAQELEAACRHHGIEVGAGDAVLVRTGWAGRHYADPEAYSGHLTGTPGPDLSAARWLADKGIRVTGSDTVTYERLQAPPRSAELPVHVCLLVEHGIHIIEVMDLEELAHEEVREFVFVAAPLKIVGGTGSPLRPLALVATP
ncbi:MAG TPA: cyclase family protein, partial [Candidatus Saccharimonadales bacterium]|nr:cyclase family protein [Candidatus Saccharimonadales bacterium]